MESGTGPKLGVRHVQVGFMLLMLAVGIGMRVHLSVAIVAMNDNKTSSNPDIPTYNWKNKSLILSTFYWGYVCLQIFAAELGRKYGAKYFLIGAMSINSTAFCLIPLVADKFGSIGVMACRVIMGLFQGFFYCNVHNTLSKWTPLSERTRLSTFALSGAALGTIVTMPIVGYISSTSLGWPFSNYLYGGLGFTWVILYFIFGASNPREHRSISERERRYIEGGSKEPQGNKLPTPWKSILTSVPVWAVFCNQIGCVWAYTTLLSEMPTYMDKVIGFDIKKNGLLSAIPYSTNFIFSFIFAYISDYLINNNILSKTWCRKLSCSIASIIPGAALLVLGFLPEDAAALSVVMLVVAVGSQAGSTSGYMVNHLDLSPNFAGIIMAICNSSSNFISIFGPVVVQLVVVDEEDKSEWRTVFIIAAMMSIVPNLFYLAFGSGKVQSWNYQNGEIPKVQEERNKKMSVISILST